MQQLNSTCCEHRKPLAETMVTGGTGSAPRKLLKDCKSPSRLVKHLERLKSHTSLQHLISTVRRTFLGTRRRDGSWMSFLFYT